MIINYGRGESPILPLYIQCDNHTDVLSGCSSVDLDVSKCMNIAGVDCRGVMHRLEELVLAQQFYSSLQYFRSNGKVQYLC